MVFQKSIVPTNLMEAILNETAKNSKLNSNMVSFEPSLKDSQREKEVVRNIINIAEQSDDLNSQHDSKQEVKQLSSSGHSLKVIRRSARDPSSKQQLLIMNEEKGGDYHQSI